LTHDEEAFDFGPIVADWVRRRGPNDSARAVGMGQYGRQARILLYVSHEPVRRWPGGLESPRRNVCVCRWWPQARLNRGALVGCLSWRPRHFPDRPKSPCRVLASFSTAAQADIACWKLGCRETGRTLRRNGSYYRGLGLPGRLPPSQGHLGHHRQEAAAAPLNPRTSSPPDRRAPANMPIVLESRHAR
jgi:hypothetical protein